MKKEDGSGSQALWLGSRAFPPGTWKNSPLMVKITRDYLFPERDGAGSESAVYIGWIRVVVRGS